MIPYYFTWFENLSRHDNLDLLFCWNFNLICETIWDCRRKKVTTGTYESSIALCIHRPMTPQTNSTQASFLVVISCTKLLEHHSTQLEIKYFEFYLNNVFNILVDHKFWFNFGTTQTRYSRFEQTAFSKQSQPPSQREGNDRTKQENQAKTIKRAKKIWWNRMIRFSPTIFASRNYDVK